MCVLERVLQPPVGHVLLICKMGVIIALALVGLLCVVGMTLENMGEGLRTQATLLGNGGEGGFYPLTQ